MFTNRQALLLKIQKLLIFALYLIVIACTTENNTPSDLSQPTDNKSTNYNVIDSLLNRISKDTLALTNYLTLAKSTGDKYAR